MVLILHNIFDKIPENGEHYQNNILAIHRQIFLSIFLQYPDNIGKIFWQYLEKIREIFVQ